MQKYFRGRGFRGRMVVGFAIGAYHHLCCEFEPRLLRGVQHYVIKLVSDVWRIDVFSMHSGFLHQIN